MTRSIVAAAASAFLLCGGVSAAQSILPNGSVEVIGGFNHWDYQSAGASVYFDPAFAQQGNRCLKLDYSAGNNQEWTHAIFAVQPGAGYHVRGYQRTTEAVSGGSVSAQVRWFSDHRRDSTKLVGQDVIMSGIGTATTSGWVVFEKDIKAPDNAIGADLTFWSGATGPAGKVYFDNITVEKTSGGFTATLYMMQEGYARQGSGNVPLARLDLLNCMAGFLARGAGNEYIFMYGAVDYYQPLYRWALMLASYYGARLDFSYDLPAQYWPLVNHLKAQMPSQQFIRYDYNVANSSRWAMSIGGIEGYLACDASLVTEAQSMASFTQKEDLASGWTESNVWQRYSANAAANRDVMVENVTDAAANDYRTCYLNDLAVCQRSWIFWDPDRGEPRDSYVTWMNDNGRHIGVSAGDEGDRIAEMSIRGVRTVPADWAWNLATLKQFASRRPRTPLRLHPLTPRDITWEDNVSYCTFLVTDGDNLQMHEGGWLFDARWYSSPRRGTLALGWQLPPCVTEYAPVIFEAWVDPLSPLAATPKDCFVTGVSGDGVLFNGAPSDTTHAFGVSTLKGTGLITDHAAALNTQMKQQAVNIITGFPYDRNAWLDYSFANYASALDRPLGFLVDTYSGSYVDGQGELKWTLDKEGREIPIKAANYALWDSPYGKTATTLATAVNAAPHTGAPVAGSFVHVAAHAWSWMDPPYLGIIEEAYKSTTQMASHVRVVRPDELLMQMRFRLRTSAELGRYYSTLSAKTAELDGMAGSATPGAATALAQAKTTLVQALAVLSSNPPQAFALLQAAEQQTEVARLSFASLSRGAATLDISCPDAASPLYHFTGHEVDPLAIPVEQYRVQVSSTSDFTAPSLDILVNEASLPLPPDGSYARVQAKGDHSDYGHWSAVIHLTASGIESWELY
jgi:hypothetical protein